MSLAPEISIIIPVYNDATHIGKSIDTLLVFLSAEKMNAEIIIVNDGGKDATAEMVANKAKKYTAIRFINRAENLGKGASVREGIASARGEFIIFTDADLPYGVKYFKEMADCLKSGLADLVIANRNLILKPETHNLKLGMLRRLTHWGFAFLVRHMLNLEFSDTQAGLKGISRKAARMLLPKLKIDGFAFDLEFLVEAQKIGLKIQEVPVILENIGESNISVIRDSFEMFKDIIKISLRY